jgi:hypothetical protein
MINTLGILPLSSWDPTTNNYAITNGSREAVPPGTKGATPTARKR